MKLDTLLERKHAIEAELGKMHYLYDNLRCSNSYYTKLRNTEHRLARIKFQIAQQLKETDEYKHYLALKRKYAEYNLG